MNTAMTIRAMEMAEDARHGMGNLPVRRPVARVTYRTVSVCVSCDEPGSVRGVRSPVLPCGKCGTPTTRSWTVRS